MNSYLVTMHLKSLAIYRVEANSEDEALQAIDDGEVDPIDEDCLDSEIIQIDKDEDEDEYDGQPDEAQEWHDFDPDC